MAQDTEITAKLDANELAKEWAKKKGMKPRFFLDVRIGARTDLGRMRENNEDKFDFCEPEEAELLAVKGSFYAVADGMGGHASGQIASELALKNAVKTYYADPDDNVAESLSAAVRKANSYIYEASQAVPDRDGMGTTCSAVVLRDDQLFVAQVGDSRVYLIRDGAIRQISEDHSWVEEQVRRGALTKDEAALSPFRNVITRSLGAGPDVDVDIFQERIEKDDILVICSDGLTGYVTDEEILDVCAAWSPSMAAMKLVDRANELGGGDNITVMVLAVRDIEKAGRKRKFKRLLGGY